MHVAGPILFYAHVKAYRLWMKQQRRKPRQADYYVANREKILKQTGAYKRANREKLKTFPSYQRGNAKKGSDPERFQKRKAYYDQNRQAFKAYHAKHYELHRDRLLVIAAEQRARNPGYMAKYARQYRRKFPEKDRANHAKRRAMKLSATIGDTRSITRWEKGWKRKSRVRCYWCEQSFHPSDCHTDHIIALRRGGAHAI
jgi:hypothetical protein